MITYKPRDFKAESKDEKVLLMCACLNTVQAFNSRQWMEFLSMVFGVSHRTAKDMYHALCVHKAHDNFKKQLNEGDKHEC